MSRLATFFYNVSGEESERLLYTYGVDGDFLARRSGSHPDNYTLSILREGAVTHVKVFNSQNRVFNLQGGQNFDSLAELITHYIQYPQKLQLTEGGTIEMKKPISLPIAEDCVQEGRRLFNHRWFHSQRSGEEAVTMLSKEKPWTYLVRDSIRAPGCYVITVKTTDDVVHILVNRNHKTGKYSVGGGDEYFALSDLITHHKLHPMVEERTQRVLYLQQFFPSTAFPADMVDDRMRSLDQTIGDTRNNGYSVEFERLENLDESLKSNREGKREMNVNKNRYRNIVAFDHSRVVLRQFAEPKDPQETDYINANYVRAPEEYRDDVTRLYITTQGCLDTTVVDFWRMIWQEDVRLIIMTTRVLERGSTKCQKYWPDLGREQTLRGYYCKCVGQENTRDEKTGIDVYVTRRFMISRCGAPQRELHHIQFCGWPDHGCPERSDLVLHFLRVAGEMYNNLPALKPDGKPRPVVVHCSAGIGRSGTFVVIDQLAQLIRRRGSASVIDVYKMCENARNQRSGMVQTQDQYVYVYRSVSYLVKKMIEESAAHTHRTEPIDLPPPPPPDRPATSSSP